MVKEQSQNKGKERKKENRREMIGHMNFFWGFQVLCDEQLAEVWKEGKGIGLIRNPQIALETVLDLGSIWGFHV